MHFWRYKVATTTELFDLSDAVDYHYHKFPPSLNDIGSLIKPLTAAASALARYDQTLRAMHNSEVLLSPLRNQEAVVSSRMEGTISTLDEILRYEAEINYPDGEDVKLDQFRNEVVEVYLYSRALKMAQKSMQDGQPLSPYLLRTAHKVLLNFGRGAEKMPGEFKTEQNYLADKNRKKILFIPIKPEFLNDGMDRLFSYIGSEEHELITRTAISHVEFESLHPFKDGNGRIGRMLIPLMLWKGGVLTEPYFYVSAFLEENKDEYIDRMREVSKSDNWIGWLSFMLNAFEVQANRNLDKSEKIRVLYDQMKDKFRAILQSQWSTVAVDFVFTQPVFKGSVLSSKSGIPAATSYRFLKELQEKEIIKLIRPASGRRPSLYSFEPLLEIVRE
jgi:Fic family protein